MFLCVFYLHFIQLYITCYLFCFVLSSIFFSLSRFIFVFIHSFLFYYIVKLLAINLNGAFSFNLCLLAPQQELLFPCTMTSNIDQIGDFSIWPQKLDDQIGKSEKV